MKTLVSIALATFALSALASEPTEKDAIAMAEKGAAFIKTNGQDAFIKKIAAKDPDYLQGSLYVITDCP